MIRFIDLRYQGTCNRFAFWDTVTDTFQQFDGEQAWKTWGDFERSFIDTVSDGEPVLAEVLERHRGLCPPWAFEAPVNEDEMYGFREILFGEAYP